MSFVYPSFLWAFALLIVPILVHLFSFRRYKTIYFSSIQFIKKVEQQTNSTRNLKHYLILATRLLAFSFLILGFAQPYIPDSKDANTVNKVYAIYLDNSQSMSANGTNGNLLNHAKETLRELIAKQTRDQQYVLVTNELSGIEHRIITSTELLDRLDNVVLSPISRPLNEPLQSMRDFLTNEGYVGSTQYLVLSDLQKTEHLEKNFQRALMDTTSNYTFLQVLPQQTKNLFIDSVWFDQPFQRKGTSSKLYVRANNFGTSPITNAEIQFETGKVNRQALVDIPANGETVFEFNFINKNEGIQAGKVTIADEQLHFDNGFYFSYEVSEQLNVIIVSEKSSARYTNRVFSTDDYYQVTNYNIDQLQPESLDEGQLIILNGLNTISSGLRTKVKQLVDQGKSLFVIPATNSDKNTYNQLLREQHLPLIADINDQSLRIKRIASEFSFFKGMFDKKVDNIRMPPLNRHFNSVVYNDANYHALIRLENDKPFFVESGKRQRVYMLYSSIDDDFNDFSKSALFSAILLRAGELSQKDQNLWLTLGSSDTYAPALSGSNDESVELKNDTYRFIPSSSIVNGQYLIDVRNNVNNNSINADIYEIMHKDQMIGKLALNYGREESRLEYYSKEELTAVLTTAQLKNISFSTIEDFQDIRELSVSNPNEYWRILLTLALVFFIVEMLIVLFWKV